MKKILFALTALVLPMAAQAQVETAPATMSSATVDATVNKFVHAFCPPDSQGGGVRGLAKAVQTCYEDTKEDSPDIDICMLGDYTLVAMAHYRRDKNEKLGLDDPNADIAFITKDAFVTRYANYTNLPRFAKLGSKGTLNYFKPNTKIVGEKLGKRCQSKDY